MSKGDNLRLLRQAAVDYRKRTMVAAVKAGQAVIDDALRRRVPVGMTHRLKDSIRKTHVGIGPRAVTGAVLVPSGHALPVEAGTSKMDPRRFIRDTIRDDGPRAIRVMVDVLKGTR